MTAKELLLQYENSKIKERILKDFISSQKKRIDSIELISYRLNRQMKEDLFQIEKKLRLCEQELVRVSEERQKILILITEIPGIEGEVLTRRYVNGEIWETICEGLNYSWNGVFRVHNRALQIVQKQIDQGALFDT